MKVLVAGGAGYIGCVLIRELLTRGYAVRVYDRFFFGDTGLAEVVDQISLETGDIRQISARQLEGIDAVINLAGISSDPIAEHKPALTYTMNVTGAVHLAQMCKMAGVRRYLFASSCSVYDSNTVEEETDRLLDEATPVNPASAYARSKLEAEQQLLALADNVFAPVLLRKGTVYGFSPRMRYDLVINTLLKDALLYGRMVLYAGGEMWRPIIDIQDAARAYAACLEADEATVKNQVFNVVFKNFRVCEMALRIREALREIDIDADIKAEYTQKPVRSYRVSGRKLERVLGFRPVVSIEESVKQIAEELQRRGLTDLEHSRYSNIRWFEYLEEVHMASVFNIRPVESSE